jgi:osmotically-inducible protein OsmY
MTVRALVIGGAVGAALVYMLDPDRGRRRRAMARDRLTATVRRSGRRAGHLRRRVGAGAYGVRQKVTHLTPQDESTPDDVTLTRRVESEVFRDADVPKGNINIAAHDGLVILRGQVQHPRQIDDLAARVRKVHGVRDVENLLHLPDTPAPNKMEARFAGTGWTAAPTP